MAEEFCGATNRAGNPCQRLAGKNGRCHLHGGKSTGAKTKAGKKKAARRALKHGIYSKGLHQDEKDAWEDIELGSIDDEIRLAKLQLARAVAAQKEAEDGADDDFKIGFEPSEKRTSTGKDGARTETIRKRPDFRAVIDRLLGRIARMEQLRYEMHGGGSSGSPTEKARLIQKALAELEDMTTGTTHGSD